MPTAELFLGEQAVELGLADLVGGVADAAKLALEMAKPETKEEPELIKPKKPRGLMSILADVSEAKIIARFSNFGRVRLLYQAYL